MAVAGVESKYCVDIGIDELQFKFGGSIVSLPLRRNQLVCDNDRVRRLHKIFHDLTVGTIYHLESDVVCIPRSLQDVNSR